MNDRERPRVLEQYRVAGEDTPIWLTIGFSLIGLLLCATAVWLWTTEHTRLPLQEQEQPKQVARIPQQEDLATAIQPSENPEPESVSAANETSGITIVAEVDSKTQSESATPPIVSSPANTPEELSDQQDGSVAEQEQELPSTASPLESNEQPVSATVEETPQSAALSPAELSEQQVGLATEASSLPEISSLVESSDQQDSEFSEQQPESVAETLPATTLSGAESNQSQDNTATESTPTDSQGFAARSNCPPAVTISFKRGSVLPTITDEIQENLQRLQAWLNEQPKEKLLIAGHADSTGSERRNLLLSHQRAKRVAELLNKAGVSPEQTIILAFGEHNPIEGIPTDSEDNRRVSLQIRDSKNCQVMSTKR